MKSVRFNDLSKASQIFAESFVEKEPEIKSRKSLNESIDTKDVKNVRVKLVSTKNTSQTASKEDSKLLKSLLNKEGTITDIFMHQGSLDIYAEVDFGPGEEEWTVDLKDLAFVGKPVNESIDSREESKIKYARKLSENGKKSYVLSKDGRNRIAGSEERLKELQSKGYDIELVFENGRTVNEALSDEANAENLTVKDIKAMGYRPVDSKWQRGYVSRKTPVDELKVYKAGGARKGQYYALCPSWDSTQYCRRVYYTKDVDEPVNEALSDEAKANNEMIQKILNKKPSQLKYRPKFESYENPEKTRVK